MDRPADQFEFSAFSEKQDAIGFLSAVEKLWILYHKKFGDVHEAITASLE